MGMSSKNHVGRWPSKSAMARKLARLSITRRLAKADGVPVARAEGVLEDRNKQALCAQ